MRFISLRLVLFALGLLPPAAHAGLLSDLLFGKHDIQVITNTEMTPAGKKLPAPSRANPQYYVAASSGFHDFGGVMGGITEPPAKDVLKVLTAELAKQGYLPATEQSPPPTLVLFLAWGTLNVDYDYSADPDLPPRVRNRGQILRFLGGNKIGFDENFFDPLTRPAAGLTMMATDAQSLYDISSEDLYVAVVAAYDLQAIKQKKKVPLWTTRMACLGRGFDFPDVLHSMVAIGGPQLGRETDRPVWQSASEKFKPDIQLGELQLVEYLNGSKINVVDARKPAATDKDQPAEEKPAQPAKR